MKLLVTSLVLVLSASAAFAKVVCTAETFYHTGDPDNKCMFYQCDRHGGVYHMKCAPGTKWNPRTHNCGSFLLPWETCTLGTTTSSTTTPPTTTTTTTPTTTTTTTTTTPPPPTTTTPITTTRKSTQVPLSSTCHMETKETDAVTFLSTNYPEKPACNDSTRIASYDDVFHDCVTSCKGKPECKLVIAKQKPLGNTQSSCSEFSSICTSLGSPCTNCPTTIDYASVCTGVQCMEADSYLADPQDPCSFIYCDVNLTFERNRCASGLKWDTWICAEAEKGHPCYVP